MKGNYCTMPLPPAGIMSAPELWQLIRDSRTKQDRINAMFNYIASQGGWAGCPKEVREKLKG